MEDQGYFIFSLDTEVATGCFDLDEYRDKRFSPDGSAERKTISQLVELFEEFNIIDTWAIVGHLLFDKCEYWELCPMLERKIFTAVSHEIKQGRMRSVGMAEMARLLKIMQLYR